MDNIVSREYDENENTNINSDYEVDVKEITVIVEGEEYILQNKTIIAMLYPLLLNCNNCFNDNEKICVLPNTIEKLYFEYFLNFLINLNTPNNEEMHNLNIIPLQGLKKVIEISLIFNAVDIIDFLANQFIQTKIEEETCLDIIKLFSDYAKNEKLYTIFTVIIEQCIILATRGIFFLYQQKKDVLLSLDINILESIIELYLKSYQLYNQGEFEVILILLMHIRNSNNDIFELIEIERKTAIKKFDAMSKDSKRYKPTKIFNIKFNETGYQDVKICFDNLNVLIISYFDSHNDIYNLAFQLLGTQKSIYSGNQITDNNLNEGSISYEYSEKTMDILNNNSNNKDHLKDCSFISILFICEIPELKYRTKINFNCFNSNFTSRSLIFKIENFLLKYNQLIKQTNNNSIKFQINIFAYRNYIFSSLLDYLCKNFLKFKSLNTVSKIPKIVINLIIKSSSLKYNIEQDILDFILNWLSSKRDTRLSTSVDLLGKIKWDLISNEALIDFLMYQTKLINLFPDLMNVFYNEFSKRLQDDNYRKSHSYSNSQSSQNITDNNDRNECNSKFTIELVNRIFLNCTKLEKILLNSDNKEDNADNIVNTFMENCNTCPHSNNIYKFSEQNTLSNKKNLKKCMSGGEYFSYLVKKNKKYPIVKNEPNCKQIFYVNRDKNKKKSVSISQSNSFISFQINGNNTSKKGNLNMKQKKDNKSIKDKIINCRLNNRDENTKMKREQSKKSSSYISNFSCSSPKSIILQFKSTMGIISPLKSQTSPTLYRNQNSIKKLISTNQSKSINSSNFNNMNSNNNNVNGSKKEMKIPFNKNSNFNTISVVRGNTLKDAFRNQVKMLKTKSKSSFSYVGSKSNW